MSTTAQIITNRKPLRGVNYEIINYYMQNKPNFRNTKTNITSALAKDYENIPPTKKCKNKPNFISPKPLPYIARSATEGWRRRIQSHRLWACFNFLLWDVVPGKLWPVTVYPVRDPKEKSLTG